MNSLKTITLLTALILTGGACTSARHVTRNTQRHRLSQSPGMPAQGYVMSYDARARGAYLVKQNAEGGALLKFCAEPPPDVSANLEASSEFKVDVDALLKLKAVDAALKGGGSGSDTATSEIANAATRTELVLVMRDAMYRVCELNANGVLDDKLAADQFESLTRLARSLGQRDNVGKLIDVVKTVATQKEGGIDPVRLAQILDTTLRLATADELIGPDAAQSPLVQAAVQKQLLEALVGVREAQEEITAQLAALKKLEGEKKNELAAEQAKPKKSKDPKRVETLKKELTEIGIKINALEPLQ